MLAIVRSYVRLVDRVNYRIGRVMMYSIFFMVGVLAWSSISKTLFLPSKWTLEVAQFSLVAYYLLGGPYSMQLKGHVRMDLFYGSWSPRTRAMVDSVTVTFLLFYLGVLLYGALNSTAYSLGFFGNDFMAFYRKLFGAFFSDLFSGDFGFATVHKTLGFLERSPTAWRPYLWPVKVIASVGIFLMLLQAFSELIKDIATLRGIDLRADEPVALLDAEDA